jgi:hypothetical protein
LISRAVYVIILIRMSCDKNEIFRQLSFRVDCLNRDIAHERAEKYAAQAEQVSLRGREAELAGKLAAAKADTARLDWLITRLPYLTDRARIDAARGEKGK